MAHHTYVLQCNDFPQAAFTNCKAANAALQKAKDAEAGRIDREGGSPRYWKLHEFVSNKEPHYGR